MIAGTIESKRENSKRRGVSLSWMVVGGTTGLEGRTIRAVGRWRDCNKLLVVYDVSMIRTKQSEAIKIIHQGDRWVMCDTKGFNG